GLRLLRCFCPSQAEARRRLKHPSRAPSKVLLFKAPHMEQKLSDLMKQKIDDGTLPISDPTTKVYAGYGRGFRCAVCDKTIVPALVEYEFEMEGHSFFFHLGCYGLWEAER